ncbi:MAG: glycosyltransferase family 87 protein [Actinomycetota bacterium]
MPGRLSDIYGLRVVERIGPANLARILGAIFWLGVLVWVPTIRADLLYPADLGSDSSNYAAAGERLAAGSTLYALQPGDRPVPADNPPEWSGPILSPPPVALPWAAMLALPDPLRFYLAWGVGLAMTTALGFFLVARLPARALLPVLIALFPLGVVAWSGNLNALLAPALVVVYRASVTEPSRRVQTIVGVVLAIAALVKLGPVFLLLWLLLLGRTIALLAAAATGVLIVAVTAWIGGVDVFADYVRLLLTSASTPSDISIPGLLRGLGLPPMAGYLALILVAAIGCIAMVVWRRNAGITFAIAVLLSVSATTIVRVETLVVGLAALAPWAIARFQVSEGLRAPRLAPTVALGSATFAILAVLGSLLTGGTRSLSMTLANESGQPVVVRFTVPNQYATFGYELQDSQAGTAWFDQEGTYRSVIAVMTLDCRIIHDFRSDASDNGWVIGATAVEGAVMQRLAALPYSARCAEELRRHREGG